ncbi:hypothetical protein SGQ83_03275 [Flavobacterium sp. Fl-318]|uniref:Uncharacterized protein n=1 Tax=Flavobacterium cupriresistens TaxID=2893885 RepID=A0ABU4R8M0_9FLAO|nr:MULTISPECIES: hypothetical protein [unclassified Flavobacterium]MDX6188358.1 hypothetical protein [Flavobacterium sp. Fl-318]UFH40601.1 hypothetical protein LNP23_12375 [Flavobacterium sp. F-323]
MKQILFFILFFTAVTVSAQTEFSTKFKSIPAPKFSAKPKKIPSPEIKNPAGTNLDVPSIKTPNVFDNTSITPKSKFQIGEQKSTFTMSTETDFANPGDRYVGKMEKDLDKAVKEAGLKEGRGPLVRKNLEFGDIYTSSTYFIIKCRDAGAIDGDMIKAVFNENVIVQRMVLESNYQQFKITFNEGFNTFELEALNIGSLGGNTGGFEIYDAEGNLILSDYWNNLDTGFKAKFVIVKQKKLLTKAAK